MRLSRCVCVLLIGLSFCWGCKDKGHPSPVGSSRKPAEGTVLLCEAIRAGDADLAKSLLADCTDLNALDRDGSSPLHCAAVGGYLDIARLLIDAGAKVDVLGWRDEGLVGGHKYTPLHYAAEQGHPDVVRVLIAAGAGVNARSKFGRTPLWLAVIGGHREAAEDLIANGANADATTDSGLTPLGAAIRRDDREMVEALLAAGAKKTIYAAAYLGDVQWVARGIAHGFDVKEQDENGHTILHAAAQGNQQKVAEVIVAAGASIDIRGDEDATPLYHAADRGHVVIAQWLMDKGANLDARIRNYTATHLHRAAWQGHRDLAELLIDRGATVAMESEFGTALDYARRGRYGQVMEVLEAAAHKKD